MKEYITTINPQYDAIRNILVELCNVKTWEGVSKHNASGIFDSYTRRIMEVTKNA